MKPESPAYNGSPCERQNFNQSCHFAAACLAAGLVFAGCATESPERMVTDSGKVLSDIARLQLGTVGVLSPAEPAAFSFDKSEGRIDYATEEAADAAGGILAIPPTFSPYVDAVLGIVAAGVAPVAAGDSALRAKTRKLGPAKLQERERWVTEALAKAAEQSEFNRHVLEAAAEKSRRQLVVLDEKRASRFQVDTILEPKIEKLQLERTTKNDASFALQVKARVRVLQASDSAVLYDEPLEFRSGTALFNDWAKQGSIACVADTAYTELAEKAVAQLVAKPAEGPILPGAGYKRGSPRKREAAVELAGPHNQSTAAAMLVDYRIVNSGTIGIYSTSTLSHVTIQRPLTKDEAVNEALDDLRHHFDGLDEFPNIVVQLGVCAASIPLSLYSQTAAIQGVSAKEFARADRQLAAAVRQTTPHEEIAKEVAQQLAPQTAQPVMLVKKPLPPGEPQQFVVMQCVARRTLAGLPREQSAADYLVSQGADSALEIEIMKASLDGEEGANSPLRLNVEARTLLLRSRDGRPIYSCPVRYRSQPHQFTEWADHDAHLFRNEMEKCYREIGHAISEDLVARGVVLPKRAKVPTLAGN